MTTFATTTLTEAATVPTSYQTVMQRIEAIAAKHRPLTAPGAPLTTLKTRTVLAPNGTIVLARLMAVDGHIPWQVPPSAQSRLTDIQEQGHAAILYDGNRSPKQGPCVSCAKMTSKAWYIHPIHHTVPACDAECVADAIESIWNETCVIRVRGEQAKALVHRAADGGEVVE